MKRFACMLVLLVFMLFVMWLSARPAPAQEWNAQAWTITEGDSIYVIVRVKEKEPVDRVVTLKLPVLTAFELHQRLDYIFDPADADSTAPPTLPTPGGNFDITAHMQPELNRTYTLGLKGFSTSFLSFSFSDDYIIRFTIMPPDSL